MPGPLSQDLKETWLQISGSSESSLSEFTSIERDYSSSNRYYHTLDHISSIIEQIEQLNLEPIEFKTITFAAFYHDIVYDTRSNDNESKSSHRARRFLSLIEYTDIDLVCDLIISTIDHRPLRDNPLFELFLDADLSILGASPVKYREYAENIRREYAWVDEARYVTGRIDILSRFLNRDKLYFSNEFRNRFETQARKNLQNEINELNRSKHE